MLTSSSVTGMPGCEYLPDKECGLYRVTSCLRWRNNQRGKRGARSPSAYRYLSSAHRGSVAASTILQRPCTPLRLAETPCLWSKPSKKDPGMCSFEAAIETGPDPSEFPCSDTAISRLNNLRACIHRRGSLCGVSRARRGRSRGGLPRMLPPRRGKPSRTCGTSYPETSARGIGSRRRGISGPA